MNHKVAKDSNLRGNAYYILDTEETMGFIDKIFRKKKVQLNSNVQQNVSQDENVLKILELRTLINSLLKVKKHKEVER